MDDIGWVGCRTGLRTAQTTCHAGSPPAKPQPRVEQLRGALHRAAKEPSLEEKVKTTYNSALEESAPNVECSSPVPSCVRVAIEHWMVDPNSGHQQSHCQRSAQRWRTGGFSQSRSGSRRVAPRWQESASARRVRPRSSARAADNLARVVARAEALTDQLIETELFRTATSTVPFSGAPTAILPTALATSSAAMG